MLISKNYNLIAKAIRFSLFFLYKLHLNEPPMVDPRLKIKHFHKQDQRTTLRWETGLPGKAQE